MRVNSVKKALKEGKLRFDFETLQDICRAASMAGLCPIVRVADLQYSLIARYLDCGAQGILLPRVEAPEILERAVSWTKFPPDGARGFGLTPTHVEYERVTIPQIIDHVNANTMVVLQIETKLAVDRRDELLSVPGIDALMIGPADLSISLGVPGEFDHPKMVENIELVRESCLKYGVAPGIHMRALANAKFWKQRGMLFLSCGSETGFMLEKATETAAAMRA
jgi:2-keto-3-deoxy-L-rhamnonate aldolase RhmA